MLDDAALARLAAMDIDAYVPRAPVMPSRRVELRAGRDGGARIVEDVARALRMAGIECGSAQGAADAIVAFGASFVSSGAGATVLTQDVARLARDAGAKRKLWRDLRALLARLRAD